MPEGMTIGSGGSKRIRMHVDCGARSIAVRFLEARILAADGRVLHIIRPGDPSADRYPSMSGISYGRDTIAMICAAAAARCKRRPAESY